MHAIETFYRGIRFRSRLESKWAAFFDEVGWRWQYEPIDFEGWIPDFVLFGRTEQIFVDVKPIFAPNQEIEAKIDRALGRARTHSLLEASFNRGEFDFVDPTARAALILAACPLEINSRFPGEWIIGWINASSTFWEWDEALFVGPPCGISSENHSWGDILDGRFFGGNENRRPMNPSPYWARATNTAQWKPRS